MIEVPHIRLVRPLGPWSFIGGEVGLVGGAQGSDPLQVRMESWLSLTKEQQDVAVRLRQLIDDQRRLAARWHDAGALAIAADARSIESALRQVTSRLLHLEHRAVDEIANTVSAATDQLRPE